MYLNTHTYYSFKYGTMSCEELLIEAQNNDIDRFVLTDINSTAACLNFVRLSIKHKIEPILGIDFRNGVAQQFIGIAKNNQGYFELNRFLSGFLHSGDPIPEKAPYFSHAFIIYPFAQYDGRKLKKNEFIGISPEHINRLRFSPYAHLIQDKMVILQTVTFRNKKDFNAHRLLRAIDNNTLLSKLPETEEGSFSHQMLPKKELLTLYGDYPSIIKNTEKLLNSCSIHFDFGDEQEHKNQKNYTHSEHEDFKKICKLCYKGLRYRYPEITEAIKTRLKTELKVIREKSFIAYFLINWDIVSFARRQGFFYVGRGSGANSIVAYLLRITDVDPIDLDLYFERFINLYRKNPPDFDIDFSWTDREDITAYIFKRFKNVALLATYSTFQLRAVIRELGKVFGLPAHEIEKIAEGKPKQDYYSQLVIKYSHLIQGFPSHLSIHAGGILISEKHIHYFSATDLPPKGYPTTHFDMVIAEDVGLYKFDILSQRGLGKIKDTLSLVKENKPEEPDIDIHDLNRFKKDEAVKSLLRQGKAIGCFYVESPAMRMLLKKLEADDYLGLVAASSIIRPGVAKSGMMREYILRFKNPERRKEAHPTLLSIMPETYGVMVYQEDVIKVAHYFAGLTLAEADVLRRGMSGKFRSRDEFQKAKDQYFSNCKAKGYTYAESAEIWRQIESFAGYAFSKGHSASYAVESYQSLFLKAYYPLEYMVATINNFGGFYRTELYVHEARMHGAEISPSLRQRQRCHD
ncbi:PHP domain-containing protein [Fulvivirga maritima]|uniref:PHP domain-containing protein n=1 Tax=Fulvivirga maritima TaxID=2904247 RepID=UPI002796080B|nr:PHP domain-containing protein [Fulvivirga maritima]